MERNALEGRGSIQGTVWVAGRAVKSSWIGMRDRQRLLVVIIIVSSRVGSWRGCLLLLLRGGGLLEERLVGDLGGMQEKTTYASSSTCAILLSFVANLVLGGVLEIVLRTNDVSDTVDMWLVIRRTVLSSSSSSFHLAPNSFPTSPVTSEI